MEHRLKSPSKKYSIKGFFIQKPLFIGLLDKIIDPDEILSYFYRENDFSMSKMLNRGFVISPFPAYYVTLCVIQFKSMDLLPTSWEKVVQDSSPSQKKADKGSKIPR